MSGKDYETGGLKLKRGCNTTLGFTRKRKESVGVQLSEHLCGGFRHGSVNVTDSLETCKNYFQEFDIRGASGS